MTLDEGDSGAPAVPADNEEPVSLVPPAIDIYAFWKAGVAGQVAPELSLPTGSGVDDSPQPGCYSFRRFKGGPRLPVRVWLVDADGAPVETWGDDRRAVVMIAGKIEPDGHLHAQWFQAVSPDDWDAYHRDGLWPGEIASAPEAKGSVVGDNSGGMTLPEEVEVADKEAREWLAEIGGVAKTKADADAASNWEDRLAELFKRAEDARAEEKAPYLEKCQEIDGRWRIVKDRASDGKALMTTTRKTWQIAEAKRLEDEQRAKIEAERKAAAELAAKAYAEKMRAYKEAEAKRKAAEAEALRTQIADTGIILPDDIVEAAPPPPPPAPVIDTTPIVVTPVKAPLTGGQRGNRKGVGKRTVYTVTDYDKVWPFVKDSPDVRAAIDKVIAGLGKMGMAPTDGVEKSECYA